MWRPPPRLRGALHVVSLLGAPLALHASVLHDGAKLLDSHLRKVGKRGSFVDGGVGGGGGILLIRIHGARPAHDERNGSHRQEDELE